MTEISDICIIGAGPAGLGCAVTAAGAGAKVNVVDEHHLPGGQLFKQIHKFFGSGAYRAGVRGYDIGKQLLGEAEALGVTVLLGTPAWGIFPSGEDSSPIDVGVIHGGTSRRIRSRSVLLATGATERTLPFPGSTLPGVMTAGAAQTLMHVNRVRPGNRVVMVGSGNIGLIVTYQLLQAGVEVVAVVEAAKHVGGYAVHANKIRSAGVPILTGHTITRAEGKTVVEGVTLARVDERRKPVPGTERQVAVDTVCLAVGLAPRIELARLVAERLHFDARLGGFIPVHSAAMEIGRGIYVAGDAAGIEEANTAQEEGVLAGLVMAHALGHLDDSSAAALKHESAIRLELLRGGPFGSARREAKREMLEVWK